MPSLKLQELLRGVLVREGFAFSAKAPTTTGPVAIPPEFEGPSSATKAPRLTSAAALEISGLTPAAKALWVAGAATRDPQHEVVIFIVPADRDVDLAVADIRFFLGGLEGSSADELDRAVLPFPSQEVDPYRGLAPHFRIASARARALHALATGVARVVVSSATALLPRVSAPAVLTGLALDLQAGNDVDTTALASLLVDAGFTRTDPVDEHGEFCIRGGVIDIFPAGDDQPARIELLGDTIESIRRYDPGSQRSVGEIARLRIVPLRERPDAGPDGENTHVCLVPFFDYLSGATRRPVFLVSERDEIRDRIERWLAQVTESYSQTRNAPTPEQLLISWPDVDAHLANATNLAELGLGPSDGPAGIAFAFSCHISCQPALSFSGRLADWIAEIRTARQRGDTVLFVAATPGRAERIGEVLADYELRAVQIDRAGDAFAASVLVTTGVLSRGFRLPDANLQIFAETDLFEEEHRAQERVRRSATKAFLSDLRDLKVGDLVVHVDNGIGEFVGLKQLNVSSGFASAGTAAAAGAEEYLELRYAGDDKLFVPVSRLDLIQKFTGGSRPALDRLGGTSWEKAKTRVKKAMRDMAEELLKLYASRKAITGHLFSPDTHWQEEFEGAFPYVLTPDQQSAIEDIKRDMESATPMDRLLCGDVGYGKTEVAMRAAFKAVMDGKQVAFLAPTTVLAFQHIKTLGERFGGFPVRIDMVSRFRTKQEQKASLADLAEGKVDIIVGTHRLLSKDVVFKDLGLLVVDEEQRFGVSHKEKIKQLRKRVDVLTMTATPIPRTLNMSLVGIRDMSIIETPPKDRLAIQTNVVKFDQQVIARAIRSELARGGQIYFVHNRVESIFSIGNLLTRLVPEARVVVGHGQMGEHQLEKAMIDFVARRFDILLATTIVENGLDIPNVNTIFINRADRYGLSQLYQLRGRVGRSDRAAYAYLLVPPEISLSPVAKKRLAAIREFSDLGSGFRVAALDLEIRGAGNLLGGEQSGHIEAVGFEMYMKLLEQAVRELKGEELDDDVRATVNLGIDIRIEESYVPDMAQRLVVYRKVAAARSEQEVGEIIDEARDRYGPLPESMLNLAEYGRIRVMADRLGLESVDRHGEHVVLKFRDSAGSRAPDPQRVLGLLSRRADLTLLPPSSLRLGLVGRTRDSAGRPGHGDRGVPPRTGATAPKSSAYPTGSGGGDVGRQAPSQGGRLPGRWQTAGGKALSPSWWTARATAKSVEPGFTKQEILKPPSEQPRAEGGIFDRVGGLLQQLLQ
ncbi:MAG: transcription-repair coupling factor [Acidobacteria bacterium]|nr:transcription-repair coupling factor [Acidobacteriota bacterium]